MKKIHFLVIGTIFAATAILSSCSSSSTTPPDTTTGPTAKLQFKKDFHANYDLFVVDSADANGNNGDRILGSTRRAISIIVIDTNADYKDKKGVTFIKVFEGTTVIDSEYFYQDPNGDLYRYNYGFSILNQFSYLVAAVGNPIDVGWVLAAKMTAKEGTTWVAKTDTLTITQFNIPVFLSSQATMLKDTTFLVDTSHVKARHVQHIITALAGNGVPQDGKVIIDSYLSTDINAIVEDFFRHVKLSGQLLNAQAQGKLKIMTSYVK